MAVTIEKRPIGVILGACVSAVINSDYSSAFATVNKTSHGLSDGGYVYIQSNVENYNGFWRIEVTGVDEFLLIDSPYVAWIVDANITYCPGIQTHGWSCVHLPIVYELSNTKYPTNSVDTVRTITSITDDNGLVNANLSGSLGTFEDLSFIKISNAPDSDFNGVYQIVDKLATNDATLNLDYASTPASGIVGASIQLYYSSYNIVVRVYAGINASHQWQDLKPYELATTLELIPDENNRVKFSINDILKAYVETKNNLLLPSLPNNIDAWCDFYIEVAEQYDTSNGYTVTTFQSGFASDQSTFEGHGVNAMLPFKNIHSGYLSEYVMITGNTAKFLTLFTIPVLFSCGDDTPDCYNDISFIREFNDEIVPPIIGEASSWSNNGETGDAWNPATASVAWTTNGVSNTEVLYYPLNIKSGATFNYNYSVRITGTWTATGAITIGVVGLDSTLTRVTAMGTLATGVSGSTVNASGAGSFIPTSDIKYFGFYLQCAGTKSSGTINGFVLTFSQIGDVLSHKLRQKFYSNSILQLTSNTDLESESGLFREEISADCNYDRVDLSIVEYASGVERSTISETKQFKIDCGCANQEILISWMNNLGAMEPTWKFTGQTDHTIDITASGETKNNIFPNWPNSYGEHADTIRKQTFRDSAKREYVFSQLLTQAEADAISYIKSSPLVQIVNSRQDRRTVIVDTESFSKYRDGDKTYTISFNILYTDDIPSQRV